MLFMLQPVQRVNGKIDGIHNRDYIITSNGHIMRRKDKIKKLAEEYLWTNGGLSVGGYAGGKRTFKKMPWYKLMQGK